MKQNLRFRLSSKTHGNTQSATKKANFSKKPPKEA